MSELDVRLTTSGRMRALPPHAGAIAERTVDAISEMLVEPEWMRELRRRSLAAFRLRPLPAWGADLSEIDFAAASYVPDLPPQPVATADTLTALGVVATDLATALVTHERLVREHLGTVVPPDDNLFAALNGAVWSGGWFVWVPAGVDVPAPIRLTRGLGASSAGCFDRVLVLVGEGASVDLVAAADRDGGGPVRAGVVEIIAHRRARVTHATLQRWSRTAYDLTTHRAVADAGASVRWTEVTLGGRATMRYPSVFLRGERATGEVVSVAVAGAGQHHDVGGKLVCTAPHVSGRITSYVVAGGGGRTTSRALVKVAPGARGAACWVHDESLRIDATSHTESHPYVEVEEPGTRVVQERGSSMLDEARVRRLVQSGMSPADAVAQATLDALTPALRMLHGEQAAIEAALREIGAAAGGARA